MSWFEFVCPRQDSTRSAPGSTGRCRSGRVRMPLTPRDPARPCGSADAGVGSEEAGVIEELRVERYGGIGDVTCRLSPLHAFIGPNDSGKSTLLRALQFIVEVASRPWSGGHRQSLRRLVSSSKRCSRTRLSCLSAESTGSSAPSTRRSRAPVGVLGSFSLCGCFNFRGSVFIGSCGVRDAWPAGRAVALVIRHQPCNDSSWEQAVCDTSHASATVA